MKHNYLKKADLSISEISFGCMSLTNPGTESSTIIAKAIDSGITLFDTADLYDKGANEEMLGAALKGKRKDVIISTKVGNQWREDGSGWDWRPEKEYILKAVDASLKRLGTDYIDLYLLHGGTIEDPIDETIEAFERLIEQGKIKHYGISSIRPNVIREYVKRSNIVAVMSQYSVLDRRPEEEILPLLLKNNIGLLARGTVAGGLLADKPVKDYLNYGANKVKAVLEKLYNIFPSGKTQYETALRYVIDNPAVTTAVMGIRTMKQLDEALAASGTKAFTTEELKILEGLWTPNVYWEHK